MWLPMLSIALGITAQDTALLRPKPDTLETIVVRATRVGAATPTSQSTLDRATIERTHVGQDVPIALRGLTALTSASDAGGFSGYSSIRLRGIDQTRLTISLDGVPLNDPEDQVLYFSNVPDLLNSVQSVRVQRGVGTSGFGTASFGGSLNFESIPIAATPRFAEAELTAGSFGTTRASVEGASGLKSGWAGYGRFSGQTTNGFRDHSGNDAWSGFVSTGWFGARDAIKLTAFAGRSKTQLAYYAASEAELAIDRRTNPMSPNERDDFHQEMVSLQYTRALTANALLTATAYRNSAAGDYDVGVGGDLWNFNLDHAWYGLFTTATWSTERMALTAGAHASRYHRDHFLYIRPDLTGRIYDNTGFKEEQSGFAKGTFTTGPVDWHADLEIRRAAFRYRPTAGAGFGEPEIDWVFVNPKIGISWRATPAMVTHLSLGRTSREPTRSDMFAGADDVDATVAAEVLPLDRVRPERVTDLEAGARWAGSRAELAVNLFTMRFRNEIAPIGAIAITGSPLRKNVPRSERTGIEVETRWRAGPRVTLIGNAVLMRARIAEYTDDASGQTYRDVAPLLSPALVANLTGRWQPTERLGLDLAVRHVGRSQLANDGNPALRLPAATIVDGLVSYRWRRVELRGQVFNLLSADAYANGYTDGTVRYLFPIADRTVLVTVRVGLGR
jgi:iron complex outermembrane receptor protein